jgi:hypothetical protein
MSYHLALAAVVGVTPSWRARMQTVGIAYTFSARHRQATGDKLSQDTALRAACMYRGLSCRWLQVGCVVVAVVVVVVRGDAHNSPHILTLDVLGEGGQNGSLERWGGKSEKSVLMAVVHQCVRTSASSRHAVLQVNSTHCCWTLRGAFGRWATSAAAASWA